MSTTVVLLFSGLALSAALVWTAKFRVLNTGKTIRRPNVVPSLADDCSERYFVVADSKEAISQGSAVQHRTGDKSWNNVWTIKAPDEHWVQSWLVFVVDNTCPTRSAALIGENTVKLRYSSKYPCFVTYINILYMYM